MLLGEGGDRDDTPAPPWCQEAPQAEDWAPAPEDRGSHRPRDTNAEGENKSTKHWEGRDDREKGKPKPTSWKRRHPTQTPHYAQ